MGEAPTVPQLERLACEWLERLAASYEKALPEDPEVVRALFPDIVGAIAGEQPVESARADLRCGVLCLQVAPNAVRHAEASTVSADLQYSPGSLMLRIADDGRGFDVAAASLVRGAVWSKGFVAVTDATSCRPG